MLNNSYDGLLDNWIVILIGQRSRRMGFSGADLDDAQQQVVLALLEFRFDATKSNGACAKTVLTTVIDRQLAMIRRHDRRARLRHETAANCREECCETPDVGLLLDVRDAIETLPELQRHICRELSLGASINQLAKSLGMSWHAVRAHIEAIRQHFERLGLSSHATSNREASEI